MNDLIMKPNWVESPGGAARGLPGVICLIVVVCSAALLASCSSGEVPRYEGLTARQWYEKGRELWENGRYVRTGDALIYFSRAIELDSDLKQAYNSRGIVYGSLKRHVLAIEDFDEAIDLDDDYKYAYNNRGITYKQIGELEEALEDFDKAIELDKGYKSAFNNRGNVYRLMGQQARALKDYDRAIDIDPGYAKAFANRAEAHFAIKNRKLACRDKRKACELGYRRSCRVAKRKC